MKNVTVCVPDDVYRNARVRAAERGTSVSALVSEYLRSLSGRESEFYVQATRGSRSDPLSHEQATGLVESFLGSQGREPVPQPLAERAAEAAAAAEPQGAAIALTGQQPGTGRRLERVRRQRLDLDAMGRRA